MYPHFSNIVCKTIIPIKYFEIEIEWRVNLGRSGPAGIDRLSAELFHSRRPRATPLVWLLRSSRLVQIGLKSPSQAYLGNHFQGWTAAALTSTNSSGPSRCPRVIVHIFVWVWWGSPSNMYVIWFNRWAIMSISPLQAILLLSLTLRVTVSGCKCLY